MRHARRWRAPTPTRPTGWSSTDGAWRTRARGWRRRAPTSETRRRATACCSRPCRTRTRLRRPLRLGRAAGNDGRSTILPRPTGGEKCSCRQGESARFGVRGGGFNDLFNVAFSSSTTRLGLVLRHSVYGQMLQCLHYKCSRRLRRRIYGSWTILTYARSSNWTVPRACNAGLSRRALEYLVSRDPDWGGGQDAAYVAVKRNHLHVLQWLNERYPDRRRGQPQGALSAEQGGRTQASFGCAMVARQP